MTDYKRRLIDIDDFRLENGFAERCAECAARGCGCGHDELMLNRMQICNMLNDAELIDAEPVRHGRWIPFDNPDLGAVQHCSICHVGGAEKTNYCPHCGAKMDKEAEDD